MKNDDVYSAILLVSLDAPQFFRSEEVIHLVSDRRHDFMDHELP